MKIGDKIKDNDPRMNGRELTITVDAGDYIRAQNSVFQEVRILKRRIYTDGKPRKSGFSLVRGAEGEAT